MYSLESKFYLPASSPSTRLVAVSVLITVVYWTYRSIRGLQKLKHFERELECKPVKRAPQKDPFFALDIFFRLGKAAHERKYLQTIQQLFLEIAPTFGITLMGDDLIFTNEPENVRTMLVSNFKSFEHGERVRQNSHQFMGYGLVTADGKAWERGRALIKPNFYKKQVADLQTFERHFQVLCHAIPTDYTPIEMQQWFFRFTLDVGTDFLLGKSINISAANASDLAKAFAWAFDVGIDAISQRRLAGSYTGYVEPLVAEAIERVKVEPKESIIELDRYTFLHEMARDGVSAQEMRDQIMNVLVATRDTSACLLSAALFEMGQHPEMIHRLRTEVDAIQGYLPSFEQIRDMKFLNSFIKETLRMHPPVPLNVRVSSEDTFLPLGGGEDGQSPIFVPKGRLCVYQMYSMHRRKDIWGEDAEEFNPSRWTTARPTFEYLPFNAGPRICPGQVFALTEAAYVIIRLLQTYTVIEASEKNTPWFEKLTLTCSTGPGVWLRFRE